jgi:hypothetical protein
MPRGRGRPKGPPKSALEARIARLVELSPDVPTHAELARRLGEDHRNMMKALEQGVGSLRVQKVRDIARALRCSTADIWPPEDYSGGEAPYKGWQEFRATDLGASMQPHELRDLGQIRFAHRVPTKEFYISLLMDYRSTKTVPVPRTSSPPPVLAANTPTDGGA